MDYKEIIKAAVMQCKAYGDQYIGDYSIEDVENRVSDHFEPDTNVEVLQTLVDRLDWTSPMVQSFVRERLILSCDKILDNEEQVREQMKNSFVHPDAWIRAAREVKEIVDFK